MMFGVFFFFKQKTAYEMRISDWSSDVCSSDLFHGLLLTRAGQRIGVVEILTGILEGIPVRHLHPRNLGVVELLIRSPGRTIVQTFLGQIGRASCRERVCQYV